MQKKQCPNGHIYDPSIYGDQCPMCPPPGAESSSLDLSSSQSMMGESSSPPTHLGQGQQTHVAVTPGVLGAQMGFAGTVPGVDVSGPTKVLPKDKMPTQSSHTVIRRPGAAEGGRRLVGFLVTYNRNPMGKAFNIYEGRNFVGRDSSCDICVSDDSQMSGKHMSILYRSVDNKFKFRDEQSSNGTFINKQLKDDGELQNYDIIRVGSTLFIFIAIPNLV